MDYIMLTEQDRRNIRGFVIFLLVFFGLLFSLFLYCLVIHPYWGTDCGWYYQPELSWYSGPIGNCRPVPPPCGCY